MLPPVDEQTLRDNPGFAKLHQMLQDEALNPDGSTKHHHHQHDPTDKGDAVQQALHHARVNHAKAHLLESAICAVSIPESAVNPPEQEASAGLEAESAGSLADLLALLPSLLLLLDNTNTTIINKNNDNNQCLGGDGVATALLSCPPLSDLESHLPELGALVSAHLHASALSVARIAHPSTNPSYLHRHVPSLPADFAALASSLSEARCALIGRRVEALASLTKLLHSYTETLALLVRTLESKHGVASRRLELQALDVSQNSQLLQADVKTALHTLRKDMYSPETISALANYSSHLKDAQVRAAERLRGLQAELAEYGVGGEADSDREKEKMMREMARVYHELESQMEDVKKDLDRLGKRV
ncbi:hypothetical protein E4U41_000044 [Claviceps citrina]|nr:hypothetical protein E4U41_000044 [Claviceps citrina]